MLVSDMDELQKKDFGDTEPLHSACPRFTGEGEVGEERTGRGGFPARKVLSSFNSHRNELHVPDSNWTLTAETGVPPLPVRPRSSALADLSPPDKSGQAEVERFEAFVDRVSAEVSVAQKLGGIRPSSTVFILA